MELESSSTKCVHSWQGIAKGVIKFVLFTVSCFKWSVKILQGIWEYENNSNNNS